MTDERAVIHGYVPPPMTPIFDAGTRLVGFFDGTYLFDLDNEWAAFYQRGHVFTPRCGWLGPLQDGSFLDMDGRPVGWLVGSRPTSGMKPSAPMNPSRPLSPRRPLRPRTPLPPQTPMYPGGGWSRLSWAQWMGEPPTANAIEGDVAVDVSTEPEPPADDA